MEHHQSFSMSSERDLAAFLSRLIHYRATKDKHDLFRAGSSLVGSMTTINLDRSFGGHWHYLAGMAYRDTGMSQEEIAVFRAGLKNQYPFPLQNRMRLQLLEDAPEQLADLNHPQDAKAGSLNRFHFQARLTEAEAAFQGGDPERGLQLSRDLTDLPDIPEEQRRDALRLMGQIYQSQGEHALAVQCFTGIIPASDASPTPPTAALPIPSRGVQ